MLYKTRSYRGIILIIFHIYKTDIKKLFYHTIEFYLNLRNVNILQLRTILERASCAAEPESMSSLGLLAASSG